MLGMNGHGFPIYPPFILAQDIGVTFAAGFQDHRRATSRGRSSVAFTWKADPF